MVLLITGLLVVFLPFALMGAGGWSLLVGIILLAADAFIASRSGGFVLRWQRRHRVPEAFIGFGAIAGVLLTCTLFHGLVLVGIIAFPRLG